MQIKRLKLSGFKSFVEPAELRIEPGLTGVVGPNGCGKSNVLEAIRWVMGESSPKSMRGAGMDDVIFAGTAARPARDFAEVSLLVEREAEDMPGDVTLAPVGDVEVARRIERGAGSAYRVNGRDVRAKDVALLFADAATGAHSPALVSQGKISAVIAAKPTERRLMLEEAAGIAGLHVRRKDAEQKLRAAEANLTRLDEVLADMEHARLGAAPPGQGGRALPQAFRPDQGRRGADDLRPLARGRRGRRCREAGRRGRRSPRSRRRPKAQRAAAAWQAEAAQALADLRSAALAARERATSLGHQLATLRAERDGIAPPAARAGGAPDRAARRPRARGGAGRGRQGGAGPARPGRPRHRRPARRRRSGARHDRRPHRRARGQGPRSRSRARQGARRPGGGAGRGAGRPGRARSGRRRSSPGPKPRAAGSRSRWRGSARRRRWSNRCAPRAGAARQAEARLEAAGEAIGAAEARRQQAAAARDSAESEGSDRPAPRSPRSNRRPRR